MGTVIYENISSNKSELSEHEKESSFIFLITILFAVLWIITGFTGIIAYSCAAIAVISCITGAVMTLTGRS